MNNWGSHRLKIYCLYITLFMLIITAGCSPSSDFKLQEPAASSTWPDSLSWWKANNLRLIQTTALEEFEGIIMER